MRNVTSCLSVLVALGLGLGAGEARAAAVLVEQLQAANYDGAGTWTATVGSNAVQAVGTANDNGPFAGIATVAPLSVAGQTPNGSSVVRFNGNNDLVLTTPVATPANGGYTAFVFLKPTSFNSTYPSMFGGTAGSFQYRVTSNTGLQDVVLRQQADIGTSNTGLSTTSFSLIDVTTSATATAFRLNGANDGGVGGTTYTAAIDRIGGVSFNGHGSEPFVGDIAELRIYDGILSASDIASVEQQLAASYVTAAATPEPASLGLLAVGAAGLFLRRRKA